MSSIKTQTMLGRVAARLMLAKRRAGRSKRVVMGLL
jgi:hypothetical protein